MEAISSYIQTLGQNLDCPRGMRVPFLTRTQRMAEDFVQGRPDATSQELADYLGEPQELAQGFLETLDPDVLERYHRRKKFLRWGCVAVLAAALVITAIFGIYLLKTPVNLEMTETIIIYSERTLPQT